jgi:hypothetical protein
MLRYAERSTRNAGTTTSVVGRQARVSETVAHAGVRLNAGSVRHPAALASSGLFDSAGAHSEAERPAERHDWLVPMELL